MDQLIARVLKGQASEAEEAELLSWRRASQDNDRYYRQLARLLGEAEAAAWEQVPSERPSLDTLTAGASHATSSRRSGWIGRRKRQLGAGLFVLAAASLAAVLVPGGLTSPPPSADSAPELLLGSGEIVTGSAETATVTLGDGSIVRLGPSSRLRITQQPSVREVWLDGRGFFAVVEQDGRPFRVRTHAGDAVVLGTRFDLQARKDDLRLLVVEGAVNLDAHGVAIDVGASQLGRVEGAQPQVREEVDATYLANERRWLGNFLVFENTPLAQAASELGAHYGVPVEVLDPRLAAMTVRGVFADEELQDVVRVLCIAVSAYCSVSPSGVTIGP
jgi:transmembrane sensor